MHTEFNALATFGNSKEVEVWLSKHFKSLSSVRKKNIYISQAISVSANNI